MSCEHQERVSAFLDQTLPAGERESVSAHIGACHECNAHLEYVGWQRAALRQMDRAPIPHGLTDRLRIIASHERQRLIAHATPSARFHYWSDRARLFFDNLMRPVALPFAGGVVSALLIFTALVPNLLFQHVFAADITFVTDPGGEVALLTPNGTYMQIPESENPPRIERIDAATPESANVVELTIDQSGRVSDWTVSRGELTPDLTNIIMFSQFNAATNMGLPISGKVKAVQLRWVQTAPIRVRS